MKVILLEVSHWHAPLYLDALERAPGVEVTAVSDATGSRGPIIAERFGARYYDGWQALLDNEDADFAFAFGPHDELFPIGSALIDKEVPFAMEKPCGLTSAEVDNLRRRSAAIGLFVAVPLIWRHSELFSQLHKTSIQSKACWRSMSFRFNAGPPERYLKNSCSWMLDPKRSGGGCTINLAVHFVDLIQRLTGEEIQSVSATMYRDFQQADVEISSMMTLVTEGGCICSIETGYNYPGGTSEQREYSFSLSADRFYARSSSSGLRLIDAEGVANNLEMSLNSDIYYGTFVTDILTCGHDGERVSAGLDSMHRTMKVIEAAYESDRLGGVPIVL